MLKTVVFTTLPPVSVGCTVVCTVLVGVGAETTGPPGLVDVSDDEFTEAVDEPTPAGPVGVKTEAVEELVVEVAFEVMPWIIKGGEVSAMGP